MNIGFAVKQCREKRGLTQKKLSEISGYSTTYLSLVETGKTKPSLESLKDISQALKIPLSIMVFLGSEEQDLSNYTERLLATLATEALSISESK